MIPSFAVADQPRPMQLELLDQALDTVQRFIADVGLDAASLPGIEADLDATALDLVKLRTGPEDREVNARLDCVAKFRAHLETFRTGAT